MKNSEEIQSKFSNEFNMYYGHGIGINDSNKIESIFKNGLRCSHNQLEFTTIPFGQGSSTLFEENKKEMNNWKHKKSKQIIIVSLPLKYHLLDIVGTPLYGRRQAAFYYSVSQEQANELGIPSGLYLKPEFVMGVYNAEQEEFISNNRYYENLNEKEQEDLKSVVKEKYISILKESGFTFSEYAQVLQTSNITNPLTEDEIKEYDKEVFDSSMLERQLFQMADSGKLSDFHETTDAILNDAQQEKIEKSFEGWLVDDEW